MYFGPSGKLQSYVNSPIPPKDNIANIPGGQGIQIFTCFNHYKNFKPSSSHRMRESSGCCRPNLPPLPQKTKTKTIIKCPKVSLIYGLKMMKHTKDKNLGSNGDLFTAWIRFASTIQKSHLMQHCLSVLWFQFHQENLNNEISTLVRKKRVNYNVYEKQEAFWMVSPYLALTRPKLFPSAQRTRNTITSVARVLIFHERRSNIPAFVSLQVRWESKLCMLMIVQLSPKPKGRMVSNSEHS